MDFSTTALDNGARLIHKGGGWINPASMPSGVYNIIFQYTYPVLASTWVHPEYQQPKIQTCANIQIWAVTAVKQLPFMAQNKTKLKNSLTLFYVCPIFGMLVVLQMAC
jgi:hypothetical protein